MIKRSILHFSQDLYFRLGDNIFHNYSREKWKHHIYKFCKLYIWLLSWKFYSNSMFITYIKTELIKYVLFLNIFVKLVAFLVSWFFYFFGVLRSTTSDSPLRNHNWSALHSYMEFRVLKPSWSHAKKEPSDCTISVFP